MFDLLFKKKHAIEADTFSAFKEKSDYKDIEESIKRKLALGELNLLDSQVNDYEVNSERREGATKFKKMIEEQEEDLTLNSENLTDANYSKRIQVANNDDDLVTTSQITTVTTTTTNRSKLVSIDDLMNQQEVEVANVNPQTNQELALSLSSDLNDRFSNLKQPQFNNDSSVETTTTTTTNRSKLVSIDDLMNQQEVEVANVNPQTNQELALSLSSDLNDRFSNLKRPQFNNDSSVETTTTTTTNRSKLVSIDDLMNQQEVETVTVTNQPSPLLTNELPVNELQNNIATINETSFEEAMIVPPSKATFGKARRKYSESTVNNPTLTAHLKATIPNDLQATTEASDDDKDDENNNKHEINTSLSFNTPLMIDNSMDSTLLKTIPATQSTTTTTTTKTIYNEGSVTNKLDDTYPTLLKPTVKTMKATDLEDDLTTLKVAQYKEDNSIHSKTLNTTMNTSNYRSHDQESAYFDNLSHNLKTLGEAIKSNLKLTSLQPDNLDTPSVTTKPLSEAGTNNTYEQQTTTQIETKTFNTLSNDVNISQQELASSLLKQQQWTQGFVQETLKQHQRNLQQHILDTLSANPEFIQELIITTLKTHPELIKPILVNILIDSLKR